jgi:oligo-1,6-glucosidase
VLVVTANCSSTPVDVPGDALPDLGRARLLLATHGDTGSLRLLPWESRIYLLG